MEKATEYLAYLGCIGMAFTGWWAFDHKEIWGASAIITAPYMLQILRKALEGGHD
ncbi:hypothetical protein [Agrobacterium sp. OT33]|uniref:hypothetical protein n=1 Tax=Agrobacterium sp. OT33 TaxID=2815338 RepID=UPI001A8C8BC1|nr:hypothetical protein [Agrobacterium sp. OT33]MBO0125166.1 hypothetical protein [Agrobacterium sp. OT33]